MIKELLKLNNWTHKNYSVLSNFWRVISHDNIKNKPLKLLKKFDTVMYSLKLVITRNQLHSSAFAQLFMFSWVGKPILIIYQSNETTQLQILNTGKPKLKWAIKYAFCYFS